jgi:hypothetical protein
VSLSGRRIPEHERPEQREHRDHHGDAHHVERETPPHHGGERNAARAIDDGVARRETGSMKPSDAPIVAPIAGSSGSMPAERANAITVGTIMFADAVLLVVSESSVASAVARHNRPNALCTPNTVVSPRPMASARPVWKASVPRAMPPP